MSDIIIQTYKVLEEFKNEESYVTMKKLNEEMTVKCKEEIDAFQKYKTEFAKIMEEGHKYHPDFKAVSQRFQHAKKKLYEHELVNQYLEAEKRFEQILNDFINRLTQSVSAYIEPKDHVSFQTKGGTCHVR